MQWLALLMFFIGGASRWPWWTPPIGTVAVAAPFYFARFQGMPFDPLHFALNMAAATATLFAAYGLGRGARAIYERLTTPT